MERLYRQKANPPERRTSDWNDVGNGSIYPTCFFFQILLQALGNLWVVSTCDYRQSHQYADVDAIVAFFSMKFAIIAFESS